MRTETSQRTIPCAFLIAAFALALALPADAQYMCTPQREERTAYQATGSCCVYINPSNGLPVNGGERLYRKQYRYKKQDCTYTEWTFFGPHWTACHSGTSCWVKASFAPDQGAFEPRFAVERSGPAADQAEPSEPEPSKDARESSLSWRPDPGVCLL